MGALTIAANAGNLTFKGSLKDTTSWSAFQTAVTAHLAACNGYRQTREHKVAQYFARESAQHSTQRAMIKAQKKHDAAKGVFGAKAALFQTARKAAQAAMIKNNAAAAALAKMAKEEEIGANGRRTGAQGVLDTATEANNKAVAAQKKSKAAAKAAHADFASFVKAGADNGFVH